MSQNYNTPKAIAESMAKRYKQFRMALPSDDIEGVFQLILDNRYKLLGNIVNVTERKEIIRKSDKSITLLTFFTILKEDEEFRKSVLSGDKNLNEVIKEIHSVFSDDLEKNTHISELAEKASKFQ